MLFNEQVFGKVIDVVKTAQFRTRKEAAHVLINAALIGNSDHVRHLVSLGCIVALCDLLTAKDSALVAAILSALACILLHGSADTNYTNGENPYADAIEECGGIQFLLFISS